MLSFIMEDQKDPLAEFLDLISLHVMSHIGKYLNLKLRNKIFKILISKEKYFFNNIYKTKDKQQSWHISN